MLEAEWEPEPEDCGSSSRSSSNRPCSVGGWASPHISCVHILERERERERDRERERERQRETEGERGREADT